MSLLRAALLALTLGLAACSTGEADGSDGGEASCALLVRHDGHTYQPAGEVVNHVATTGREVDGVLLGCDDSGGQEPAEPDEGVRLAEIEGVPVSTAVLWNDEVLVRAGRELPADAAAWFEQRACSTGGRFRLVADWLGVRTTKRVRFDGDLRLPYRLEVRVTAGPQRYAGSTLLLHADTDTDAALGPREVRQSLGRGGQLAARVECREGRFHARSVRVP